MMNVLICNRGLSAVKFIISLKDWLSNDIASDHEYKIKLFGFVSNTDLKSQYKYVTLLDQQIYVEDNDAIYTDIEAVIAYCKLHDINVVFPGWGYLSENEQFVRRLEEENIIFIGPSSRAMEMVGNKLSCNEIAQNLGVPVLPWSGDKKLETYEEIEGWCEQIGYPVMLKAGNSGGGKGIRVVRRKEDIYELWQEIVNEVTDAMIYVCKYIEKANHFEIQIVGDGEDALHLHGRDCSTQRRNQKLVEECPITKANPETIRCMEKYAVDMMRHVGYRCLATVEFIYDQLDEKVYILEVNPRVQVEHIVTERLFGINLIKIQFLLAMGKKLNEIDDLQNLDYDFKQHIVSARINSEDPYQNFRPIMGKLDSIDITYSNNTWGYFSMERGGEISSLVDSQFGHVIGMGCDRLAAIRNLANLLDRTKISGTIYNTGAFIKNYVISDTFKNNNHYTKFLHTVPIDTISNHIHQDTDIVFLSMIYNAYLLNKKHTKDCIDSISKGHTSLLRKYNQLTDALVLYKNTKYCYQYMFQLDDTNKHNMVIYYKSQYYAVSFDVIDDILCIQLGPKQMFKIQHGYVDDYSLELTINQHKYSVFYKLKDSNIKSPVGGKLVECVLEDGATISKGDVFIKIECMKMIMSFPAEKSGVIRYHMKAGDIIQPNDRLAVIEPLEGEAGDEEVFLEDIGNVLFEQQSHSKKLLETIQAHNMSMLNTEDIASNKRLDIDQYPKLFSDKYICLNNDSEQHKIGIKAWLVDFAGGEFVLLTNDIQHNHGTFSYHEDELYHKVLLYARENKLPFVHFATNSGAEIRINNELKFKAKPEVDGEEVLYLYLTPDDYKLHQEDVEATYVVSKDHYRIDLVKNSGVSNLDGSALLVREMAKARNEIPTFTFVLERTVGVGAYLAKLSERVIQRRDSSILLTGYGAINKVLGNALYESNLQLGGSHIMGTNGISHKIVDTTMEGIDYLKEHLALLSSKTIRPQIKTTFKSTATTTSYTMDQILDPSSFIETMEGYAATVRTGRARINGRAYGVIFNTKDTAEKYTPCDPGNLDSKETNIVQSPGILYPDTSYKIAKTIHDTNTEGLPILIACDWRGFSGGTRDMHSNVLDFGSMIVSELTYFGQTITIYVPPHCQLRGGSMVVFSKSINPDRIQFCTSKDASINVLEPNAAKELKFKRKDVEKYAKQHNINEAVADKSAMLFTALNDRVSSSSKILNKYEQVIDHIVEPTELRSRMA